MRTAELINDTYHVGKTGENNTMQVPFPVGKWLSEYPGCSIHLAFKRPKENCFYDVQNVEIVGDNLIWTVQRRDVEIAGAGIAELMMIRSGEDQAERSKYYAIKIEQGACMGGTPSDPAKDWFMRVIELEEAAIEARDTVTQMQAEANTLEEGEQASAYYDHERNVMVFYIPATIGPQGPQGPAGVSPEIEVTAIMGGHEVTITDAEHPDGQTFDVMDGEKGDAGVSPEVTVTAITGGHQVKITDEAHPDGQTFDVTDGEKGEAGVSPAVTVTAITGGHQVKITDEAHPDGQTFDVMDGEDGDVQIDDTTPSTEKVYSSAKFEQVVGSLNQAIQTLDELKATKAELALANARLKENERTTRLLNEAIKGRLYTDESVTETSYQQTVPSGSLSNAVLGGYGGKSIVWNQHITNGDFSNGITGWTNNSTLPTTVQDGVATVTPSQYDHYYDSQIGIETGYRPILPSGHKAYVRVEVNFPVSTSVRGYFFGTRTIAQSIPAETWTKVSAIINCDGSDMAYICGGSNPEEGQEWKYRNIICVDLTQMYGAGNEPSSVDDVRIRSIEAYALSNPEYNSGEIVSADVDGLVSRGRNLLGFNDSASTTDSNGLHFTVNGDGSVRIVGTATQTTYYNILRNINNHQEMLPIIQGTTFTDTPSADYTERTSVNSLGETIAFSAGLNKNNSNTVFWTFRAGETYDETRYPYIYKGNNAPFSPYRQPIECPIPASVIAQYPLRSAGNVYDTITYEPQTVDGVTVPYWYHTKNVSQKVMDGTEQRTDSGANNAAGDRYAFFPLDDGAVWSAGNPVNLISAQMETSDTQTIYASTTSKNMIGLRPNKSDVEICFAGVTTFQGIVDKLVQMNSDGNPLMFYYALATHVRTDITELMQSWDGILEVEEGGTVTFKQVGDTIFAVPNTVHYLVKTTGGA